MRKIILEFLNGNKNRTKLHWIESIKLIKWPIHKTMTFKDNIPRPMRWIQALLLSRAKIKLKIQIKFQTKTKSSRMSLWSYKKSYRCLKKVRKRKRNQSQKQKMRISNTKSLSTLKVTKILMKFLMWLSNPSMIYKFNQINSLSKMILHQGITISNEVIQW